MKPSRQIAEEILSEFTDYITQRDAVTKLIEVARAVNALDSDFSETGLLNLQEAIDGLKQTGKVEWL